MIVRNYDNEKIEFVILLEKLLFDNSGEDCLVYVRPNKVENSIIIININKSKINIIKNKNWGHIKIKQSDGEMINIPYDCNSEIDTSYNDNEKKFKLIKLFFPVEEKFGKLALIQHGSDGKCLFVHHGIIDKSYVNSIIANFSTNFVPLITQAWKKFNDMMYEGAKRLRRCFEMINDKKLYPKITLKSTISTVKPNFVKYCVLSFKIDFWLNDTDPKPLDINLSEKRKYRLIRSLKNVIIYDVVNKNNIGKLHYSQARASDIISILKKYYKY